jgi:hypothetical protein
VDGDKLSPQLLNGALDDVGDTINAAARQNPLTLDPQFMGELNVILNRIPSEVGDAGVENSLRRNVDNIFRSINQNRQLPGEAFVGIRSNLSALSRRTPIARDIQDVMFNALERSGGSPAELRNALAKYRNIKLIQNSLDRGTEKTVSPGRLASTINQIRNRTLGQRGLGHPSSVQLSELAQAGVDLIPETLGNSGTFGRALAAAGQDVSDAVKIGAGAAALPLLLQRGFNAQGGVGNYLSGAGPQVDPLIETLLRQGIISGGLQSERE